MSDITSSLKLITSVCEKNGDIEDIWDLLEIKINKPTDNSLDIILNNFKHIPSISTPIITPISTPIITPINNNMISKIKTSTEESVADSTITSSNYNIDNISIIYKSRGKATLNGIFNYKA